jgi:hypothetical protein
MEVVVVVVVVLRQVARPWYTQQDRMVLRCWRG